MGEDLISCGDENGIDYNHLSPVAIMTLIVVGILSIYRFDKCINHKLNENPVLNRVDCDSKNGIKFKKMPPLKDWFDTSLKYKFIHSDQMNDVSKMFGFDTMNQRKRGGLQSDNISWIMQLTQDFIERHYGIKSNATLIKKFIDRKNKLIAKKYKNLNKEYREQYIRNLNEYKSFNSFSIIDKKYKIDIDGGDDDGNDDECKRDKFEYYGYDAKDGGDYSL